jgi:anthranilate phosphoribosyltransferase
MALDCPLSRALEHLPGDGSLPFAFLLAPHYHQSLAPLVPVRKSLPFRTILNLLGPLVNPAEPNVMILGVPHRSLGQIFAEALRESGNITQGMVVCGAEGLDEISCAGSTWVWKIEPGKPIQESSIHPSDFGLPTYTLDVVKGGSPQRNAVILEQMLKSQGDIPSELEPILDFILVNASALLVVGGTAKDYKDGVRLAKEAVHSGAAWTALTKFREVDAATRS